MLNSNQNKVNDMLPSMLYPFNTSLQLPSNLKATKPLALSLYHTIPTFNDPEKKLLENIVGKEKNAGNQHFFLFPQCFLPL